MKALKNISALLLLMLILVETIGVHIIRDICTPCQNECVAVQMMYVQYESDCYDSCHSVEKQVDNNSYCCFDSDCANQEHEHEKDVQILNQYPDFFENNAITLSKLALVSTVVFNNQICDLLTVQQKQLWFNSNINKLIPPDDDIQSFLCTYLI